MLRFALLDMRTDGSDMSGGVWEMISSGATKCIGEDTLAELEWDIFSYVDRFHRALLPQRDFVFA